MQDLSHLSIDAATACLLSPKRTRVRLALIRHLNKCVGFMQDLSQLSRDAVRPYVLPWDVSKLLKCLNGLLSPKPACFGYHEPSLFCTTWGVVHPLPEGQPAHRARKHDA